MANGYSNSVPLGQQGTGAAQILGPNRALQYFLNKNEQDQNRLLREQQTYQQKQQAYGDQFQKTLYDMNQLAVSPMFSKDFNTLTNTLIKQGAELKAQGINPYNPNQNPNSQEAVQQWQGEVNKLKQAKVMVDNLYKERADLVKKYNANPSSFDFDEFGKIRDFEKNNTLEDIVSGNVQFPTLSEVYDIGKGLTTKYGEVYTQGTVMENDASGNPIRREVKEADKPRIANIVNSEFIPGTQSANEVDRRLRKEFGDGATVSGLLGTTNKDEIRNIIDSEFRNNTSELNPIVELMSTGRVPSLDSKEYNDFLEKSVEEQLKAEKILDNAKQQAANSLIGKVNPKDSWKFDFTLQKESDRRARESRSAAKDALSITKLRQDIVKGNREAEGGLGNISDVTITTSNRTPIVMAGATSGSTTEFEYNPTSKSYNIEDQKYDTNKRESAKLLGVGVVAIDKNTGIVYPGDPRDYIGNPNAEFEVKAQVRAKVKRGSRTESVDYLEDPVVISNSLAGENKKFATGSITRSRAVLNEFQKAHGQKASDTTAAPKTTKKLTRGSLDNL